VRMSELSARSGLPVATIKYYLREGLLPPGRPTAPNQAEYDEAHLRRLRLVRVLIEVGDLGISAVRAVVDALADETIPLHDLLGTAHYALGPPVPEEADSEEAREALAEVDGFLERLGWQVSPEAPACRALASALVALRRLGRDVDASDFEPYARVADDIAAWELERTPDARGATRSEIVEFAVIGTVVYEAALVALRRLAQEHRSAAKFGTR
jgi:DNA-binding transcriptional MerR regulator